LILIFIMIIIPPYFWCLRQIAFYDLGIQSLMFTVPYYSLPSALAYKGQTPLRSAFLLIAHYQNKWCVLQTSIFLRNIVVYGTNEIHTFVYIRYRFRFSNIHSSVNLLMPSSPTICYSSSGFST
jgi:hypothetical protein